MRDERGRGRFFSSFIPHPSSLILHPSSLIPERSSMTVLSRSAQLFYRVPSREIRMHGNGNLAEQLPRLEAYIAARRLAPLSRHPAWLPVLEKGLQHSIYCLEATERSQIRGLLCLAYVRSRLFGRFLVSLPYLDYGGVTADDEGTASALIDRAVELADQLDVRYLELRHEGALTHASLNHRMSRKVHLRLDLPRTADLLWKQLDGKVRNQIRKGMKSELSSVWGGEELLPEFYRVFSRNMRDLGTPVFSRKLFRSIVRQFPERAEFCVVRAPNGFAIAAALILHGWGISEVPSASSLRPYNHTNANMLMYWRVLERTIERGQHVFDFGRSSQDSNTYSFKKQWGAVPYPAEWQYYLRRGGISDVRPDNPKYRRSIRTWQRLPVWLTRWIGPAIVRGIP
jgi:FemAB-related protein (PEP-CTERM system-associated)